MYLHFECGVWMYGSSAVAQVKEDALTTFEQCEQINMDYCRKEKFCSPCTTRCAEVSGTAAVNGTDSIVLRSSA